MLPAFFFRGVGPEGMLHHLHVSDFDSFGPEVIRRVNYATKVKGGVPSSKIISSLSDMETTKRARTIISKLCDSGRLSKKGTGRSTTYIWID